MFIVVNFNYLLTLKLIMKSLDNSKLLNFKTMTSGVSHDYSIVLLNKNRIETNKMNKQKWLISRFKFRCKYFLPAAAQFFDRWCFHDDFSVEFCCFFSRKYYKKKLFSWWTKNPSNENIWKNRFKRKNTAFRCWINLT